MTTTAQVLAAPRSGGDVQDGLGVHASGGLTVVTLSNPSTHNALRLATWLRLEEVLAQAGADPGCRVVVVRGSGSAFASGADISEFPSVRFGFINASRYNSAIESTLNTVMAISPAVIAMIDGLAVGGGCEFAAACDLRLASERARFGIPIGRLGVMLGVVEARALVRLIGVDKLKYLLMSGRLIDAREALAMGLVNEVTQSELLVERVADIVDNILRSSDATMRAAKIVANLAAAPLQSEDDERLAQLAREVYDGADLREGVAAFLERRPPQFPAGRP